MEVYIAGQRIIIDPKHSIGKGGEADVYDLGGGKALKIFKRPDHPDYQGFPQEQQAARERIAEHQEKLRAFPRQLPPRIVRPQDLALDRKNQITGYTMRFLKGADPMMRYAARDFREKSGIGNDLIVRLFTDLYQTLSATHAAGMVIGDFNNLNVLVIGTEAYLIDTDSFQFGPFFCRVFTAKFVDPLLCPLPSPALMPTQPYSKDSDWYAYTVMLLESLLCVDPYGGVYRPKDPSERVVQTLRPAKRITIFHPEVRYPKTAFPYAVLPDDLLQHFRLVFEKDRRGAFPLALLQQLRWTRCRACGLEHARPNCPSCAQPAAVAAVKLPTVIRGKVTALQIFRTEGVILFAVEQNGELMWLYHENGEFKREDGNRIGPGTLHPRTRYRIRGKETWIGKGNGLIRFVPGKAPQSHRVDCFDGLPVMDTNDRHGYWLESGQLFRDGFPGQELIGQVLEGQTLFWTGRQFGFGFYRAANLSVSFVFDAQRRGINDRVPLALRGQLIDAVCTFSEEHCWFFAALKQSGKMVHQCVLIGPEGLVHATAEAEQGDGSWLSTLHGCCAAGPFLFAPTEEGIVRLENENGRMVITKEFPDTEPFVDSGCRLFAGKKGIYVVGRQEIQLLTL